MNSHRSPIDLQAFNILSSLVNGVAYSSVPQEHMSEHTVALDGMFCHYEEHGHRNLFSANSKYTLHRIQYVLVHQMCINLQQKIVPYK